MKVHITNELMVDTDFVESVLIENRFYMNGGATYMVITMASGKQHRIEHGYGIDVYQIKSLIENAKG